MRPSASVTVVWFALFLADDLTFVAHSLLCDALYILEAEGKGLVLPQLDVSGFVYYSWEGLTFLRSTRGLSCG